jgi:hypothetical protein
MRRTEPPQIATWMLEHCAVGDCNEALAGDLREGYSSGLSNGWYWRQVFAACTVSWSEALRVRASLLIFTLLWSMMAPAWKVFIDGLESAPIIDRALLPLGLFWIPLAFAGWLLLNATFLWTGMLVYILTLSICGKVFPRNEIRRAFLLAPFVYAPVFGAWFVFCCLDWSFAFADQTLATTSLGQIADLKMVADVMRVPYFITLMAVLWNAIPQSKRSLQLLPAAADPIESSTEVGALELVSTADSYTIKRFFFFFSLMVVAGLMNAMLPEVLLCRLLELHFLTFSTLFIRAVLYVVIGVLAGVGGSWLYWKSPASLFRKHPPIPFPLFALVCVSGWIWVPSMVSFSEQSSYFAAIVAAIGAVFLAVGLRKAAYSVFSPAAADSGGYLPEETELFSESLYRASGDVHGYWIAFLLYAGVYALLVGWNYGAAALFALSAFLFAWKLTYVPGHNFDRNQEYKQAARRLAYAVIPAVLVTAWALLDGVAHRNLTEETNATANTSNGASTHKDAPPKQSSTSGLGGYESLILWPLPEKKPIVAPISEFSLLAPGTTRPLIIPFNGPYWYLQPPNKTPGPTAHQSHGTPIGADIASINSTPLVMNAHQLLGAAIPIARCREIQVEVENRDNRSGVIALAVLLTDTASPKKPTLYLGQQAIVSTKPENFSYKSTSVFETLRFSVPASAKMRRFDKITVMMLPDVEHELVGAKIAIKQFQLFPR